MQITITENQADLYIRNILQFPEWKQVKEKEAGIDFVTRLVQRFLCHSYFHNIGMLSTPSQNRRPPGADDIINSGIQGLGGVCYHQNSWFVTLLTSLGFEAYIAAGSYVSTSPSAEGTHCIGILILDGATYALDVGCGNPVHEPIPLEKEKLPWTGVAAGFRYEYRYNPDGDWYERWQLDGTTFKGKFDDENERQLRYRFTLRPKSASYFEEILEPIFTNGETSVFLRNAFLFRSLSGDEVKRGWSKFIVIFGRSAVIYDKEGREVVEFSRYKDMHHFILEYFPKLDPKMVEDALDYLDKVH